MKISATLLFFSLALFSCKNEVEDKYTKLGGAAFGTSFQITYNKDADFTTDIDSLFKAVNKSLSTYIPGSAISKINSGDTTVVVDALFAEVYQKSLKIYKETGGIFDPTIGPLVNAWGFGPKEVLAKPDTAKVKQLMARVGFEKVHLKNNRIRKDTDSIYFDFNAIAKGFAVDVVGRFLEGAGVNNYLVEIGGEIRTRGVNKDKQPWKVGIEEPNFDGTRSIKKVIELKDEVMATSGSYRKFKVDSLTGKKYVHIIDATTGYPTRSNLLSVSIIGIEDCADTDGYATALMVMPLEKAKQFLQDHQELRAYLIYSDNQGNLQTYTTANF